MNDAMKVPYNVLNLEPPISRGNARQTIRDQGEADASL